MEHRLEDKPQRPYIYLAPQVIVAALVAAAAPQPACALTYISYRCSRICTNYTVLGEKCSKGHFRARLYAWNFPVVGTPPLLMSAKQPKTLATNSIGYVPENHQAIQTSSTLTKCHYVVIAPQLAPSPRSGPPSQGSRNSSAPRASQPYMLYNNIINTISNSTNAPQTTNARELDRANSRKLLGAITTNLIKSELTKCCGDLPIEPSNGKLIAHLLTTEQIEVLERHRALMREVLRQSRQQRTENKQASVSE